LYVSHLAGRSRRLPFGQGIVFGDWKNDMVWPLTDDKLEAYGGFSPAEWQAVNRGNAERLFPRLKA